MPYTLSNRLPDPDYKLGYWGEGGGTEATADNGPGFSSVKLTSDQKVMLSRTNSGRVLAKAVAAQKWKIDIEYHPMTQDEFRPIDAFLQAKQGALTPFFVALPQYNTPKNTNWVNGLKTRSDNSVNSGAAFDFKVQVAAAAGDTSIVVGANNYNPSVFQSNTDHLGIPLPGEVFTLQDSSDTNHTKAYMITHVETNTKYVSTASRPSNNARLRLGVSPPLAKDVAAGTGSDVTFLNPLFKVIMPSAVRSYSLNTNNLYKFNLKLEEYL